MVVCPRFQEMVVCPRFSRGYHFAMIKCTVAGEELVLLPERAAFWTARRTLFIADFHLGKAASFRKAGIPLPSGTTQDNVARMDHAIARTRAKEVVFLGDFLHSAQGRAPETFASFAAWRESRRDVALTLVRGNHDKKAGDPPEAGGMRRVAAGEGGAPCVFNHGPGPSRAGYALSGHIHPAVRLSGPGEDSLR